MRRFVGFVLMATLFAFTAPARAHVAEGTITLTVAEETPPPTGTTPAAGGIATIEVNNDLAIEYEVTVHDLTGPALAGHIHVGAPGVPGDIVFGFTKIDNTTFRGETPALTAEQLATLLAGGFYVNVHTATNLGGEIRGQIKDLEIVRGTCSCGTLARKDFLKCVNGEIKKLDAAAKKSDDVKRLKKAVKKSACGLAGAPKKKPLACCLAINEAADAVSGKLCVPVKKDAQCAALDGTIAAGASCVPNPCTPAAF